MTNGPTDDRPRRFYVSAIDGPRRFIIAGPYDTHQAALDRVQPARDRADEIDGRAWFMAWGTSGQLVEDQPIKTPLGVY